MLSASDSGADLGGSMAPAAISHEDQSIIVSSKQKPYILLGGTILANQKQVGTCVGQDLASYPVARKLSPGNREYAPIAGRSVPQFQSGWKLHRNREQVP